MKNIWNLLNSKYDLQRNIELGLIYNTGSVIAENIRYFIYKYGII